MQLYTANLPCLMLCEKKLKISVVIPVLNEAKSILELIENIEFVLAKDLEFEIIVVDDGSTDNTRQVVLSAMKVRPHCRLLANELRAGQSAAVHSGVQAAQGEIVCTLDGDGQNPPSELPKLIAPLKNPEESVNLGLVAGQRTKRQDSFSKRLASKFANGVRSHVLNDDTVDTGCGLKAFRRDAFLELPYFNHMHRYLPALFKRSGWRIVHVDVEHRPRKHGKSNYSNLQRGLVGIFDMLGVYWLIKRKKAVAAKECKLV